MAQQGQSQNTPLSNNRSLFFLFISHLPYRTQSRRLSFLSFRARSPQVPLFSAPGMPPTASCGLCPSSAGKSQFWPSSSSPGSLSCASCLGVRDCACTAERGKVCCSTGATGRRNLPQRATETRRLRIGVGDNFRESNLPKPAELGLQHR